MRSVPRPWGAPDDDSGVVWVHPYLLERPDLGSSQPTTQREGDDRVELQADRMAPDTLIWRDTGVPSSDPVRLLATVQERPASVKRHRKLSQGSTSIGLWHRATRAALSDAGMAK